MTLNEATSPRNIWDRPKWQLGVGAMMAIMGLIALIWAVGNYWPNGTDYFYDYYPVPRGLLTGQMQLYTEESGGFALLPWSAWLLELYALWPYTIARALIWLTTVVVLIVSVIVFTGPENSYTRPWMLAFSMFNLATYDALNRLQLDAFCLLGVLLAWLSLKRQNALLLAAGYIMMLMKPPNVLPVGLFFLYLTIPKWPWRKIGMSIAPPLLLVLLSFVLEPNWPERWRQNLIAFPRQTAWLTTIWRARDQLHIPIIIPWLVVALVIIISIWMWHRSRLLSEEECTLSRLMLILAATFMITPYALSYQYVTLIGVNVSRVTRWKLGVGAFLFVLTFNAIARIWIGVGNAWIDIFFVLATLLATLWYINDQIHVANSLLESSGT